MMPRHVHRQAFAAVVLSGDYVEAGDSGRHRVSAGQVIFHAAYENHLDQFGLKDVEVLVLPIPLMWDGPVLASLKDPDVVARAAERDATEALTELLASIVEEPAVVQDWPDLLASDLRQDPELSLREWSRNHGLHPGSVSRGFCQLFGVTPVEFRSVCRTRKAMQHLAKLPLSEVAAASGFADQPHMSRVLKRQTGLSPLSLKMDLAADSFDECAAQLRLGSHRHPV